MKRLLFFSFLSMQIFAQGLNQIYQQFEKANYEKVIDYLNQPEYQLRKDAKYLGVRSYLLGVSHSRLQEFHEAINYFNAALKYKNKTKEIYYELGQAHYAVNNLNESITSFKSSIKSRYKIEQSTYYIAYIHQLQENIKEAKKYYRKLLTNKETSKEMKQIAYYQIALLNLETAKKTRSPNQIVKKYIIPDLYNAIDILPNSSTADDIEKRIKDIEKEFHLEEDKLISGAPLPSEKLELSLSQKIAYDNNVTRSDDLPSSTGTNKDSFYSQTQIKINKSFNFKRRYTLTPSFDLSSTTYSNREDSAIYTNDSYNLGPQIDFDFAYRYKKKPARLFFNLTYDYQARDINSQKERQFTYRSTQYELGTQFSHFEFGDTSVSLKTQNYIYYTDTFDRSSLVLSLDQIVKKTYGVFIFLYQFDKSEYENDSSLNTSSHLFRVDYLYPEILPNTILNMGLADMLISYDDSTQSSQRGIESNISFNTKLIRTINNHFSFNVEYLYTNNLSDTETSNYSAHQTSFEINYDY